MDKLTPTQLSHLQALIGQSVPEDYLRFWFWYQGFQQQDQAAWNRLQPAVHRLHQNVEASLGDLLGHLQNPQPADLDWELERHNLDWALHEDFVALATLQDQEDDP